MSFESATKSVVTDIMEHLKDMSAKHQKLVQKTCQDVLADHKDTFKKVFEGATSGKSVKAKVETKKRSKTWLDIWRSSEHGAKKYFAAEYEQLKVDAGAKPNHFTICKALQLQLNADGGDKFLGWVAEVRKTDAECPTEDPVIKKESDEATVVTKKTAVTEKAKPKPKPKAKAKSAAKAKAVSDSDAESSSSDESDDSE